VGQTVENLANAVCEMEHTLAISHEEMVKMEKIAKRQWNQVVELAD